MNRIFNMEWGDVMKSYFTKGLPDLTNEDIKQIGHDFLQTYEKTNDRKNKDAALISSTMSDYEDSSKSLLKKWMDLFQFHHQLEAYPSSELRKRIKSKIESSFKGFIGLDSSEVNVDSVMRALTFERGISQHFMFFIGNEYLKAHPNEKKGFFGSSFGGHTNQKQALELVEASSKYLGQQSWIQLYLIYNSLKQAKKDNGSLANTIKHVFMTHFHEPIEKTIEALKLQNFSQKDLETSNELPEFLKLPYDAEEHLIRLQAERLFPKKQLNTNLIEDMGIFWVNRSPYLRIVATGGVTVFVPVAAGLFFTANVYAVIGLGIAIGGGMFVLELVGNTGLKIETIPDSALEMLRGNYVALHSGARKITQVAETLTEEIHKLEDVTEKQGVQISMLSEENKKYHNENNTFRQNNKELSDRVQNLHNVSLQLLNCQGQQEALSEKLKILTESSSKTVAELYFLESETKKNNEELKERNKELKKNIERLERQNEEFNKHMQKFVGIIDGIQDASQRNEKINEVFAQLKQGGQIDLNMTFSDSNKPLVEDDVIDTEHQTENTTPTF